MLVLRAASGITEYLACHLGDLPNSGASAELRLFQLQPDGTYR